MPTLVAGRSFTDSTYGVTFNVVSSSATALTVQVTTPGGTVTPAATTTTLGSSANPAAAGVNVTLTATVAGSAPTGTVKFSDGTTAITNCSAVALAGSGNSRTAACTTSGLAAGTHAITASYSGDANNKTSTSSTLAQTINSTSTGSINVALATNGGVASASSTYGASFAVSGVNNNERAGKRLGQRQWRLERRHRKCLSGLGADQFQRQQDHRPRGRLHRSGQLRQPGRAVPIRRPSPCMESGISRCKGGTAQAG